MAFFNFSVLIEKTCTRSTCMFENKNNFLKICERGSIATNIQNVDNVLFFPCIVIHFKLNNKNHLLDALHKWPGRKVGPPGLYGPYCPSFLCPTFRSSPIRKVGHVGLPTRNRLLLAQLGYTHTHKKPTIRNYICLFSKNQEQLFYMG